MHGWKRQRGTVHSNQIIDLRLSSKKLLLLLHADDVQ